MQLHKMRSMSSSNVVIVQAVRTPIGRRGGGLSTMHPADVLGVALKELIARSGIDPAEVEQVVGGCVSQVGEQSFNITRTAWLGSGVIDVAIACGVEVMSRIPIGINSSKKLGLGVPIPKAYFAEYEMTSQFEGAERIADKYGVTRADTDAFALESQRRAAQAWKEDRFAGQYVEVNAPDVDEEGKPTGTTHLVKRDEGLRDTTAEGLAGLKPVARENGVHTAGNSSQISDGASAVLMMTEEKAKALGLKPRARIDDSCLVGVDPILMLEGPIDATQRLLKRNNLTIDQIDNFEINEAFASVVLAWARATGANLDVTNPNGGAIALGHPLGATGGFLLTKSLYELERTGGRYGIISMCCGGGLGTGTLIERL